MWLRLRQIALVAQELEPVELDIARVLGVQVCYRDPGVAHFGLHNALFPIGNELLEVVAPTQDKTAAGRYLQRRGGDGGYMVITQCDDHAPRKARVAELGVRIVNEYVHNDFSNMQLHPKDTGGSFFEIDEQMGPDAHAPDGPWEPAGPDWQQFKQTDRVGGIVAAHIQCEDPAAVAARWADIAQLPVGPDQTIQLSNATLHFGPCSDGRPEGLGGIDIQCNDAAAILAAADAAGARSGPEQVYLCGLRINLV